MSDSQQDIRQQQDVEFYAASINAWFNTRFEHDKSLMTLSAGAVGLLITLISTVGVRSIEIFILYVLALFCFVGCLGVLLWIFRRNATHISRVIQSAEETDSVLTILDRIAVGSFMLGVVFSSIIGISTAAHAFIDRTNKMTEKDKLSETYSPESFGGFSSIKPPPIDKSINNVAKLRPEPQPTKSEPEKKETK